MILLLFSIVAGVPALLIFAEASQSFEAHIMNLRLHDLAVKTPIILVFCIKIVGEVVCHIRLHRALMYVGNSNLH